MHPEKASSLLSVLQKNPKADQRDMSEAVGLSLGMTNILLKELVAKGWVMVKRLNARHFQYILTPDGMAELSKRTFRFIKKTIKNLADFRQSLDLFVQELRAKNFTCLVLQGPSELAFLLDFLCQKHAINFQHSESTEVVPDEKTFVLHGENSPSGEPNLLQVLPLEVDR